MQSVYLDNVALLIQNKRIERAGRSHGDVGATNYINKRWAKKKLMIPR